MVRHGINTISPVSDHLGILVRNGLVLDTMVRQGINTTSPVSDYRGDLHSGAERPGARYDGSPGN